MGMTRIYLKTARLRKRLTQAALARRVRKPQSFISKLERGEKTDVTVTELQDLARELEIENPLALRFGPTRRQESVA